MASDIIASEFTLLSVANEAGIVAGHAVELYIHSFSIVLFKIQHERLNGDM
jgi:hypothetical protein